MFTLQRTAAEHKLLVKERDVLISPSGVFTQTQYICHTANVRRSTLTSCYLLLVFMSTPPAQRTSKHQHSSSKSNTWGCVSSGESQPVTTNCGDVMSLRFWRFLLYIYKSFPVVERGSVPLEEPLNCRVLTFGFIQDTQVSWVCVTQPSS